MRMNFRLSLIVLTAFIVIFGFIGLVQASSVDVHLEPSSQTWNKSTSTEFELWVYGADNGIQAYNITMLLRDTSVARIDSFERARSPTFSNAELSPDGSRLELHDAMGYNKYSGPDERLATITVFGVDKGFTSMNLDESGLRVYENGGASYDIAGVQHASMEVLGAELSVYDAYLSRDTVCSDDSFYVNGTAENIGVVTEDLRVVYRRNGTEIHTEEIRLGPGESTGISYWADAGEPGVYSFNIAGAPAGVLKVEKEYRVVDTRIHETGIPVGDEVTYTAEIENTGSVDCSFEIESMISGVSVGSQTVDIEPGEVETVNFTESIHEKGFHNISVAGDIIGEVDVRNAELEILSVEDPPSNLTQGDTLSIDIETRNRGYTADFLGTKMKIDGVTTASFNEYFEVGESKHGTLESLMVEPGNHSIEIGGMDIGSVYVEEIEGEEVNQGTGVRVLSAAMNPTRINESEEVRVQAHFINSANTSTEIDVELYLSDEVISTQTVALDGFEDKKINFTERINESGNYTVRVGDYEVGELVVMSTSLMPGPNGLPGFGLSFGIIGAICAVFIMARRRL